MYGVTIYTTYSAICIIKSGIRGDKNVNIYFLYGLASANLLIDIFRSYFFFINKNEAFIEAEHNIKPKISISLVQAIEDIAIQESQMIEEEKNIEANSDGTKVKSNVNMMSAFTHVGGDTIRTLSVFIAAAIVSITGADSTLCDAWAALVVTFSILCMTYPLVKEIYAAWTKYG